MALQQKLCVNCSRMNWILMGCVLNASLSREQEIDIRKRPSLNLASFVGTYMEREAEQLMIENLSKNMSDADEYPAMMDLHARCVSIIAHLWGVQKGEKAIGTATTGSSEAIHLGGLAMKRRWQERRMAEGKDTSKPNILMG
jgi:glutamate decarboxylase